MTDGDRQWISIRGRNAANTVLLMVHGGSGTPEMPTAGPSRRRWRTSSRWCSGTSGASASKDAAGFDRQANLPKMTLAQHIADIIEVIEHLRRKLSKQRVVLLGYSWGSSIGVHVAAQHPDLLSAYVDTGQVTSQAAEAILHAEALAAAERYDNAAAVAALRALAPYPGPDGTASLDQMIKVRGIAARYDALWYGQADRRLLREVPYFAPEYTDEDVELFVQGSRWMQESVLKRLPGDVPEATRVVDQFAVPVVVLQGAYDLYTPWAAAKAWFDGIQAPHKAFVTLHRSSHTAFIEEPGRFLVALIEQVLSLTEGSPDYVPAPRAWRTE